MSFTDLCFSRSFLTRPSLPLSLLSSSCPPPSVQHLVSQGADADAAPRLLSVQGADTLGLYDTQAPRFSSPLSLRHTFPLSPPHNPHTPPLPDLACCACVCVCVCVGQEPVPGSAWRAPGGVPHAPRPQRHPRRQVPPPGLPRPRR
eukprot:3199864-Rhodomonas_salina.1